MADCLKLHAHFNTKVEPLELPPVLMSTNDCFLCLKRVQVRTRGTRAWPGAAASMDEANNPAAKTKTNEKADERGTSCTNRLHT